MALNFQFLRHFEWPANRQRVARTRSVFHIFTSKCAERHNGVHCFDISTSKNGPGMVSFATFHFHMCFAPERRALFPHLNFHMLSETDVFCNFSLPNVLRVTTESTFLTSPLPKMVRDRRFDTFPFQMCFATQRHALFHFSSAQLSLHPPL